MDTRRNAPHLDDLDIAELTEWRRVLHRNPELSGEEAQTAARVVAMLTPTAPDRIVTGLGGHGVAAIYDGATDGPTIMLRCELDALPIAETGNNPHRSQVPGKGHLCGHDGHMAILAGVGRWLSRNRPARGRAMLLFQPAEEDGSGAEKVLEDPRFADIGPDYAFSLHNFPGVPLGHAVLAAGPMNCASRGMKILLTGRTAHASQPENGLSPASALARLIDQLGALGSGTDASDRDFSLVTVTHARLGEPAFGIAPGEAELWVTLRTQRNATMQGLVATAESCVTQIATAQRLGYSISYHDVFDHCENDPQATRLLQDALDAAGVPAAEAELPMRGSEDFGRFGATARSAMFLLGSGTDCNSLHNPDYDFPDDLIAPGASAFIECLIGTLGQEPR